VDASGAGARSFRPRPNNQGLTLVVTKPRRFFHNLPPRTALGFRLVRLALMIEGQEGVTWDDWVALASACEEHGVEALFRSDHYISWFDESRHVLDAWATIAGLAARTTRLELGTLVSPVTFRHPSVLARSAATADEISGGRITLGLGAGWMEREHEAYGFDFGTARDRVARFGEQLQSVHRLLREDNVHFDGSYYQLHGAPGLGRGRDQRELLESARRIGSRFGREPQDVLDRYGEFGPVGTVEQVVERLKQVEQAGYERVMLQHLAHQDLDTVALIGRELAPAV